MNDFFLWPDPDPLAPSDIVGPRCSSESVESQLRDLYPCAEPVLFSSARAGLSAALLAMGLGRPDMCWTPPFSSHCVLEAVALACTPAPVEVDALRAALVYHQWGYVAGSPFGPDVRLIEDAVDSLLLPGRSPFALGGECVLWSLPKVLRVQGGGVVFCRSADLAGKLRAVRARRTHSWLHACLRLKAKSSPLAARYWNGAEAMQGELPAPMRRQVRRALSRLPATARHCEATLAQFWPQVARRFVQQGRLPSNLALTPPANWERLWGPGGRISSGLRSFPVRAGAPRPRWIKVAPLPVHAGVTTDDIQRFLSTLAIEDPHELEIL